MNTSLLVALAERIGWTLLHSLWQGAGVALLLALLLRLLRGRSAAARHAASMLALLAFTTLVAGTAWRVGASSRTAQTAWPLPAALIDDDGPQVGRDTPPLANSAADAVDSMDSQDGAASTIQSAVTAPLRASWRPRFEPLLPWMSAVWLIGVALLTLRHVAGWRRLRAMRRSGTPARRELQESFARLLAKFGSTARVRLLESAEAAVPLLTGLCKPAVLLPIRVITGLGEREIEAILAHELAHLARRDAWSNFAQVAIETLFFYHPAVWWMGHRARLEREIAADDLALKVCADRRVYVGALAHLAELRFGPQPALAATGGNLLARIQRIVRPAPVEPLADGWSLGIPVLLVALGVAAIIHAQADDTKTINVAPGESIQAAIDAAPAGALIRLGAGEWKERIIIAKPLTLEGAGWDKTMIRIEEPQPADLTLVKDIQEKLKAAADEDERAALEMQWARHVSRPAILAANASAIVIRRLRVQGHSTHGRDTGLTQSALIAFVRAQATLDDCLLAGPFGNGVQIRSGSDATITRSLIAAIWNIGISVAGKSSTGFSASRAHLADTEVRNCYHRCITLGPGCDNSLVERCRISGSAWHGIRYDDASPTIIGNAIFGHARSGIYASGNTRATVRGNLLWRSEMDGMSCWVGNTDTIEGNTFAMNKREGFAVLGGAKPVFARNIVLASPVAVSCGRTSGDSPDAGKPGEPVMQENIFAGNQTVMQIDKAAQPAPEGTLTITPVFRDPFGGDFSLAEDCPARAAKVGAADPLPPVGPWLLLAEEKAIIPDGEIREYVLWTKPGEAKRTSGDGIWQKAKTDAYPWVTAAKGPDAAKRTAAIEDIRAAIEGTETPRVLAGLSALWQIAQTEFDRASFRRTLRTLIASPDAQIRAPAVSALGAVGDKAEDLERLIALTEDPSGDVRASLVWGLQSMTGKDFTGRVGAAIVRLMDHPLGSVPLWHALWGTKISPEIEARVVAASRTDASPSGYGDVFYYALCPHLSKREPTVTRLLELTASSDGNVSSRAFWGLTKGVAEDQQQRVADFAVRLLGSDNASDQRWGAIDCLAAYGTAAQVPAMKAILALPAPEDENQFRQKLEAVTARLSGAPTPTPEQNQASNHKPTDTEAMKINSATLRAATAAVAIAAAAAPAELDAQEAAALREKVAALEKRIAELEGGASTEKKIEKLREENKQKARARAVEDNRNYKPEELAEIESLYQVANKNWRTDEARTSLKKLLEKYDRANRTGCATLYMGQMSEGQERIDYLTRAVEKFSDCFYFDGCQVGGYGRYVLALTFWEKGEKDKARALLAELKTKYKDAIDHKGRPMGEVAEAAEKELAAKQ